MEQISNTELELAYNFVEYTNENVFLTGKAGTGKTTFLHSLKQSLPKYMIVTAPTGVAAINAGGVTLHSFFQLPFSPYLPNIKRVNGDIDAIKFNKTKIDIIKAMDLLVIDEISMVRADTLDAVDNVMRQYRNKNKPFGGVQLLMIGDLQQLSPVIGNNEWDLLKDEYNSPYFFESKALKSTNYAIIELQHIYRQTDAFFIDLLNSLRNNDVTTKVLAELNKRYLPIFEYDKDDGYIFLTSHNYKAKSINNNQLARLKSPVYSFKADILGNYPELAYPTDEILQLKLGTQVMFVKNDPTSAKRFFNGKIGVISKIDSENVEVTAFEEDEPIVVTPAEWKNMKYSIDQQTQEFTEDEVGSFKQYPLKTAWAITIHKSQGLTFDKTIIDAADSFSHGQVYVALSRCKTLEGIVLSSPLRTSSIVNDNIINQFTDNSAQRKPTPSQLQILKKNYYVELLIELFDFTELKRILGNVHRQVNNTIAKMVPELFDIWRKQMAQADKEIFNVSRRFQKELYNFYHPQEAANDLWTDSDEIPVNDRIYKGCQYCIEKMDSIWGTLLIDSNVKLDDDEMTEEWMAEIEVLNEAINIKKSLLISANEHGFSVNNYLRARSKAQLEKWKLPTKKKLAAKSSSPVVAETTENTALFNELKKWRFIEAERRNIPTYIIAHNKTLTSLCNSLPQSETELMAVPGVGKKFVENYGKSILELIQNYKNKIEKK